MTTKTIIIVLVVISAFILGGSYFFLSPANQSTPVKIASYSQSDSQKPRVELKTASADIGQMKVADQKSQDFTLKNIGTKPLQLSDISSSCMCTAGQIIIDGKESEEFGMHSKADYIAQVDPGKTATVRVTYRPFQMPVYGAVEREVYVTTNDPQNPKLVFKVQAFVK